MLSRDELVHLLSDLESDRVERTASLKDTDKFARAVCAFANDMPGHRKPGYLLVGVDDNGRPTGLRVTDELLRDLAGLRSDGNFLPLPTLAVGKYALEGGDVAVVEVQPSDLPPVRYNGRICVRVGPRRAFANEQEERRLSERRGQLVATFDVQPVPEADLSRLALWRFHDYRLAVLPGDVIEENHRTIEESLAALRFFDLRRRVATVCGVLLFGSQPRQFLPGAYVQFIRFPGSSLSELPIDQAEIDGDLRTVIDALHLRVKVNNVVGMATGTGFRDDLKPAYPEWALRELLHNAIVHRDYASTAPTRLYWFEDRVEIQNPGGLHGEVTIDTLTRRNSYRNPALAEAMKGLGFVNRFGFGLQRAERMLADDGNPPMEIDADASVFAVTVRRRVG